MAKDSIGREHQVATIQLDMNLPERFDLSCINEKGEKERIVMMHCAIMGSIERFSAVLIEHLGGNFPLWLSPVQVAVIPVNEVHNAYAETVADKLREAGVRVTLDTTNESMGKKIRAAKKDKLPYFIVIGDKEVAGGSVTLETRGIEGNEEVAVDALLTRLSEEIRTRK
jgi:threonyl-tRNA synthetase